MLLPGQVSVLGLGIEDDEPMLGRGVLDRSITGVLRADQLRFMITWSMPTSRAAIQGDSGLSGGNWVRSSS